MWPLLCFCVCNTVIFPPDTLFPAHAKASASFRLPSFPQQTIYYTHFSGRKENGTRLCWHSITVNVKIPSQKSKGHAMDSGFCQEELSLRRLQIYQLWGAEIELWHLFHKARQWKGGQNREDFLHQCTRARPQKSYCYRSGKLIAFLLKTFRHWCSAQRKWAMNSIATSNLSWVAYI